MRAMILSTLGPLHEGSQALELVNLPDPEPARGEVRLRVSVCGVCHTELDEIEGRTPPPKLPIVPGHEVVGYIDRVGPEVERLKPGMRVGVGWIHSSSGEPDENLSTRFRATGRDVNGGYAEFMTVPQDYAYEIPAKFSDPVAAPLLCAGAVGYRALMLANLKDGNRLGLFGFGGSAHLVLQVAKHMYPNASIYVFARGAEARRFATDLGATWAGAIADRPPEPLHAAIDTTPAWEPVVAALAALRPGGRLVINAIRKEDHDKQALLSLSYHEHLWMERELKTVANVTRFDIEEFLQITANIPLAPEVTTYPLEAANDALLDLKFRPVRGAKVLLIAPEP